MTPPSREKFFTPVEWKFLGFLALAFALTPIFYGLPLLSPLFALGTSVRLDKRKMVWLWTVSSLLVLMSIAPFILRVLGLSSVVE